MKTSDLKTNINLLPNGYGHYKITYYTPSGNQKTGITSNMQLIDRVKNADIQDKNRKEYGMTLKQALQALKNHCK